MKKRTTMRVETDLERAVFNTFNRIPRATVLKIT